MNPIALAISILLGTSLQRVITSVYPFISSNYGAFARVELYSTAVYPFAIYFAYLLIDQIGLEQRVNRNVSWRHAVSISVCMYFLALILVTFSRSIPYAVYLIATIPFSRELLFSGIVQALANAVILVGLCFIFLDAKPDSPGALNSSNGVDNRSSTQKPTAERARILHLTLGLSILLGVQFSLLVRWFFRVAGLLTSETIILGNIAVSVLSILLGIAVAVWVVRRTNLFERMTNRRFWVSFVTTMAYAYLLARLALTTLQLRILPLPSAPEFVFYGLALAESLVVIALLVGVYAALLEAKPADGALHIE